MNWPEIEEGIGSVTYSWKDLGLRVEANRLKDDGNVELAFYSENGNKNLLLHTTRVNVMSTTTMNTLSKRLKEHSVEIPWADILTYITGKTMEIARRGEPVIDIEPSKDDDLTPAYLLEPVLYLSHPAVIFGDYGSCKSLIGLALCYILQLPFHDNNLGLTTIKKPTHCLYLDYEDDPSSFRRRWSALEQGFGKGPMPIAYKRMTSTLSDSVEELQRDTQERGIKLLVIDSLGPAARGNLNDPEPAIKYHAALRQLNITSLTLAHCAKDGLLKKRTIFGSVFFTNLARSVWECKCEQEVGENEAIISLKHTKANFSRLHPPLGYRFSFGDRSIKLEKTDLRDTSLSGELPLTWQIKNLLRGGALTVNAISEALQSNPDSTSRTLRRMRKKEQVIKLENDTWGLLV